MAATSRRHMRRILACLLIAACAACADTELNVPPPPPDGSPSDSGSVCGSSSITTVCIEGTVHNFVDPTMVASATASSGLVLKLYDAISYVVDPTGSQPL